MDLLVREWQAFLTALQFLTRIRFCEQTNLTVDDFGRSTRYFTIIGLILGGIYFWLGKGMLYLLGSANLVIAMLVLLPVCLTGGLMLDGFMDTADGVFSGRDRERQLEIMKDSRVGSFGAIALGSLLLINWSALRDIPLEVIPIVLLLMPLIGRLAMVMVITAFPYARKEGMGKIFAARANKWTLMFAGLIVILAVIPFGVTAILALAIGLFTAWFLADWLTDKLGGLTGDTYGAIETITEIAVLLVYWLECNSWNW